MSLGTLLIRADASPEIGTGHVMRCLALAQEWKRSKGDVTFVSAAGVPFALERIRKEGFRVEMLSDEPGSPEDAYSTKARAEAHRAKWVVIDGYHFGPGYVRAVHTSGSKLLVIDDEGGRDYSGADLILNQNLHAAADMYSARRSKTSLLLGTQFVMLREEFIEHAPDCAREIPDIAKRIVMTFGGGTRPRMLTELIRVLGALGPEVELAVVGCNAQDFRGTDFATRVSFLGPLENVVPAMTWADIAVSAAGSTCWELCRLGVPAILIDLAENQYAVARELASRRIAMHIPRETANSANLLCALQELLPDEHRRREMSDKGMKLIDGRGVRRVVAALRAQDIHLREAAQDDARLLWNWRNDAVVRSASFSGPLIPWDEHCNWIAQKLRDKECRIWVAEENGCALGTVQAQKTSEGFAELGITIAPEFRGHGLAPFLLRTAAKRTAEIWGVSEIHALIKPQNVSSIKAFEEAGFKSCGPTNVNGCDAVRYVTSAA